MLNNGHSSVEAEIKSRYVKYLDGLRTSPSKEVRVMFGVASGDVRTTTGRNIQVLRTETGLDPLSSSGRQLKAVLVSRLPSVPERDLWRTKYLAGLLEQRGHAYYRGEDFENLTVLIDSLCTS